MQACYVNTTHPDFLNGHKATSIVNDRINANKPQPPEGKGKAAAANTKDLDVDIKKEDPGFFWVFLETRNSRKEESRCFDYGSAAPSYQASSCFEREGDYGDRSY